MHLVLQVKDSQNCQSTNLEVSALSVDMFEAIENDDYNSDVNDHTPVSTPTSTESKGITFQYCSSDSEIPSNSNLIQPSIKTSFRNQRSYERKKHLLFYLVFYFYL